MNAAIAVIKSILAVLFVAAVAAGTIIWHTAKGAVRGAADGWKRVKNDVLEPSKARPAAA